MPRMKAPAPPIHIFRVAPIGGPIDLVYEMHDVWRDIEIAANQTLEDLGHLIPHAFDFEEAHMWSFFLSGKPWDSATEYAFQAPFQRAADDSRDAAQMRIQDAPPRGKRGGKGWLFIFDYGDEWHFDVAFRGVKDEVEPKASYPRIVRSHGDAPPQYAKAEDEWDDEAFEGLHLTGEGKADRAELAKLMYFEPGLVRTAMAQLDQILKTREFESDVEFEAYINSGEWIAPLTDEEPETPLEQAQELVYEAWEAPTKRVRVRLARRALELSPDCADAYNILAADTARSVEEEVKLYRQAVAAGERALPRDILRKSASAYWEVLETRPYMRARANLAETLWEAGQREEAIGHWEEMLRLNPSDNQGIRYILLDALLESDDHRRVGKLLKRYPDDATAHWAYGAALHAFAQEGDGGKSQCLLAEAREVNPFVPAYLTGKKRLPKVMPEFIGVGDLAEAKWCAADQMGAWQKTPGALDWLAQQS